MIVDYKKIDLFGKQFIQKIVVDTPFEYTFPTLEQACFIYILDGSINFQTNELGTEIPTHHSLLLNCLLSGKSIRNNGTFQNGSMVIVTFHPEILKKIYENEIPTVFQKGNNISNQSNSKINNDFLIQKYIEGLLFYFENPDLANEDILILKLKEIILLLSQTQEVSTIQVILSQLFSPTIYNFKQIIEANLYEPINLIQLAYKFNLSISSFKREFKNLYNDSPANYIKNKRLEKATILLKSTNERITDIALTCGFNDLANFTKNFNEKYGLTPTNYRIRQKQL